MNDGRYPYVRRVPRRLRFRSQARRGRDRRRRRWPLPIASIARPGPFGKGVRQRIRRRRNMVLEPVPRRPLRLGRLHLPVPVLRGPLQRLELEREISRPAGDRTVDALCRRPPRPAQGHRLRHDDQERALQRSDRPLDADDRHGPHHRHAVPGHLLRHAVRAAHLALPGQGVVQGAAALYRALA